MKQNLSKWTAKAFSGWKASDGCSDVTDTLSRTRSVVESVLSQIARGFGRVGDQLEVFQGLTGELQENCHGLLEVMGTGGECLKRLGEVSCSLRVNTEEIRTSVENSAELRVLMSECETSALALLERQNSMIDALKPLRTMLVLFKIEAAALPAEHQSTFNSVAEEILKLHTLVDEAFKTNISKLTDACAQISKSIERIECERGIFASEIEKELKMVEVMLGDLERQISGSELNDAALKAAADRFSGATRNLVLALQFEDIVRQRCEAILQLIDNGANDLTEEDSLMLVLAEQLEMAAKELAESISNIEGSLGGILDQSRAFEAAVGEETLFGHLVDAETGTVRRLLDSRAFVQRCALRNRELIGSAQDAVAPVGLLAKSLSDLVVEMSIDIQFIALNAQVRSIQVGEGSGLEVLAARTADISTVLRELGEETSGEISTLEKVVQRMARKIGAGAALDEEEACGSVCEEEAAEALESIRQGAAERLNCISELVRRVDRQVSDDLALGLVESSTQDGLNALAGELRREVDLEGKSASERRRIESEVKTHATKARRTVHTQVDQVRSTKATSDSVRSGSDGSLVSQNLEDDVVFF